LAEKVLKSFVIANEEIVVLVKVRLDFGDQHCNAKNHFFENFFKLLLLLLLLLSLLLLLLLSCSCCVFASFSLVSCLNFAFTAVDLVVVSAVVVVVVVVFVFLVVVFVYRVFDFVVFFIY